MLFENGNFKEILSVKSGYLKKIKYFSVSLKQKLPRPKNKFGIKTSEKYYKQIRNKCEDFV